MNHEAQRSPNGSASAGATLPPVSPPPPRIGPRPSRRTLRRAPLLLLGLALLALAGLAAAPSGAGAAPPASDPSVLWAAELTGEFCDTTRLETTRRIAAKAPCADRLSALEFAYNGQTVTVLEVLGHGLSIGFDRALWGPDHSGGAIWGPIRSRLFVWFGTEPFPLRDAILNHQGPDPDSTIPTQVHTYRWFPERTLTRSGTTLPVRLALAPAAPTGVTSSPRNSGLALTWRAPSGPVTGYDVQYKTAEAPFRAASGGDPATGWVDAGYSGRAASTTIRGLTNDTTYEVRVRARNNGGWSDWARGGAVWHAHLDVKAIYGQTTAGCESTGYDERQERTVRGLPWYTTRRVEAFCNDHWFGASKTQGGVGLFEGALSDEDFVYQGETYRILSLASSRTASNQPWSAVLVLDKNTDAVKAKLWLTTVADKSRADGFYRQPGQRLITNLCRLSNGLSASASEILDFFSGVRNPAVVCSSSEPISAVGAGFADRWAPGDSVEAWLWDPTGSTPKATAPAIAESRGGRSVPVQESAASDYSELIAQIRGWRDDPCCAHNSDHTGRWDRVLLAFGETVADTSLTPMTADEAQTYADRGWQRWTPVVAALRAVEAAASASEGGSTQPPGAGDSFFDPPPGEAPSSGSEPGSPDGPPTNRAPSVAAALADVTGLEAGTTREVPLAGTFSDPDADALTITAASSDEALVTVTVAADSSALTLTAVAAGTATITVTAEDPVGERVSGEFDVTVSVPRPQSTLTGAAGRYDVNANGQIDVAEYIQALRDRARGKLTEAEWDQILNAYLASAYG